jgi:hypothetical protein
MSFAMAARGLIGLLLLVTSCSGDACKAKAKRAEATAAPEAPVTALPITFDDVPLKIRDKAQLTLPPIFPAISKLPASVRSAERYSRTSSTTSSQPIMRALEIAFEFCDIEPIGALARWKSNFYAPEGLANALNDERLAPRLECGAKAAIASGFQWYIIRFDDASHLRPVGLLPRDARIAPKFYETPATMPAGLEQLSCDELDGDRCAAYAHAMAVIPRLDMLAVGELGALTLLAAEPAEKWNAADPARLPALTTEETASADVAVVSFADGGLGRLGAAFWQKDDEDRAVQAELRQALQRAEAVGIVAVPAFQEGTAVIAISTRGHTDDVAKALAKLQQAAARGAPSVAGEAEDQYSAAIDASQQRGMAEGTIETKGNEVRFRFKWAFNAAEIELRRQGEAAATTRLIPLAAVLTARVASEAPKAADLEGVGIGLAKMFTERAARKRGVVPTMTHDSLPYLKLPSFQRQGMNTGKNPMVGYGPASPEKVDDLLDTLRNDGWRVKLASTWKPGPIFRATKKERRLQIHLTKASEQELRVSVEDN